MAASKNTNRKQHIRLRNTSGECDRLYEFLADNLAPLPVTEEFRQDLKLVSEELLANIINHGYDDKTDETVDIELEVDEDSVSITFTDSSRAYNPLAHTAPGELDDLSQGGMGILLVKSLTDEQHYRREDERNVFTVIKNYNK